ncbi:MAG: DUF3310 domain-containing protein [Armatimonadetes bacterium]|nr:DUF3310 domain-containing protein [Armatimonadota bacterium]
MAEENPVKPDHYANHTVEPIDLIESYGMGEHFCRGNVIKYVARAPEKDKGDDDMKALFYLLWILGLRRGRIASVIETVRAELRSEF